MEPKTRRIYVPKIKLAVIFTVLFVVLFALLRVINMSRSFMTTTGITPTTLFRLVFDAGADLKPIDGRVNILLLGIPGGNHDGTDLTDTILVLSFHQENQSLAMVSVPRDIWSDTLKDKVNSAYHYGEVKKKGGGLVLAKAIVSDVVGLPLQYALVLDFSGFRKIIDLVGGVEINVQKSFTDTEYPVPGKEDDTCNGDPLFTCRYEPLHFESGSQVMDGERALKYVRSRHAEGNEGSDFARGKRQQEMLLALKSKLLSKDIYLHPGEVEKLYAAFDAATDTDMNMGELLTVGKLFMQTTKEKTQRISLEDKLYTPPSSWYGRYVLLPVESFDAIHAFVKSSLQ
ncbi:LCP family protein [Candidatus Gottesmanbacteria bacterium]|nr:LCP family protein [Candidatus Gottesmanbacteria bacterium]